MNLFKIKTAIKEVYFALICTLSYFILTTAPVQAAGLWVFEQGTPDLGTAAAGRAAMANDASTAFGNPAGMTRLKESQMTVDAQALFPQIKFNADDSSFDRQYRLAAGLQYELNQDFTLGAAYQYLNLGDANIDRTGGILRGDLKGKYKKNHIHFIGLNAVWKF